MMAGREGDAFRPRWLVTALPALLRGARAEPALSVGLDVEGALIVLHLDDHGARTEFEPDLRPRTILAAAPDVIVGLAAGALTADQAVAAGSLRGDIADLRRAFDNRPDALARPAGSSADGP